MWQSISLIESYSKCCSFSEIWFLQIEMKVSPWMLCLFYGMLYENYADYSHRVYKRCVSKCIQLLQDKNDFTANLRLYHRYKPEIPEPAPSLSWYGAPVGGIRVFPTIKITGICQVCMCCGLSVKIKMRGTPHGAWRSWKHFVCVCFRVCSRQKPEYPS